MEKRDNHDDHLPPNNTSLPDGTEFITYLLANGIEVQDSRVPSTLTSDSNNNNGSTKNGEHHRQLESNHQTDEQPQIPPDVIPPTTPLKPVYHGLGSRPAVLVDMNDDEDQEKGLGGNPKKGFTIFGYRPSQIRWFNVIWLAQLHVLAVVGYIYVSLNPVQFFTAFWTVVYGLAAGISMGCGAHRLWAHKSYKATWFLR